MLVLLPAMKTLVLLMVMMIVMVMVMHRAEGKVQLVDSGYEGVIIAINPDIEENKNMLQRLEEFIDFDLHSKLVELRNRRQLIFTE
ncbi:calcium-activated chloride channel regulator 1 [Plakobranchus ocellatus]|uniref:Calcium-activated chloride channel regulator 1 n=1 Tax=Plakobranchus ocellatus TaxID=259542 RepID=A0AAV4DHS5_9GAST|nr:calcium-activated chloride channel regulator 1 [Plakobranchus ocellatus]